MDDRTLAAVMTQRLQTILGQQMMDLVSAQARIEALEADNETLRADLTSTREAQTAEPTA